MNAIEPKMLAVRLGRGGEGDLEERKGRKGREGKKGKKMTQHTFRHVRLDIPWDNGIYSNS
jgi:hypothetical protein